MYFVDGRGQKYNLGVATTLMFEEAMKVAHERRVSIEEVLQAGFTLFVSASDALKERRVLAIVDRPKPGETTATNVEPFDTLFL